MNLKVLLYFILGLALLVGFHEFGHFLAAKIFGVYVYEFSLFMGPKLFQLQIGETKYTLRLLPIGGYCSMAGEEDSQSKKNREENEKLSITPQDIEDAVIDNKEIEKEESEVLKANDGKNIPHERTMLGIANWKKAIITAAGAFNNILLCFFLMIIYYANVNRSIVQINPNSYFGQNITVLENNVGEIKEMSIAFYEDEFKTETEAASANLQGVVYNDEVYSYFQVEGIYENAYEYFYTRYVSVRGLEYDLSDKAIYQTFKFKFAEVEETVSFTRQIHPVLNEDKTAFTGYEPFESLGISSTNSHYGFFSCVSQSAKAELKMAGLIYNALGQLFTKEGAKNVSGIIGMYSIAKTYIGYGFNYFILFLATISVNLGIMNLLPFPALDGGRIVMIIYESITKKKVPVKVERIINMVGFIILLALIVVVTIKDIFWPVV